VVRTAPAPSDSEAYCAWYGDRANDVLYFGQAAFWSGYRARGGDPTADMETRGPLLIGRFDLRHERMLPPLDVRTEHNRTGVWDVLAHPNGRIYFTTFFSSAGFVDPESGRVRRFDNLGSGLNELAAGPGESILVSRYAADGRPGSILQIDPEGRLLAEHPLGAPERYSAAPKTVAWDPARRAIWVTNDLLPEGEGAIRHDAAVLAQDGRELQRITQPELQFVTFRSDGVGYAAEAEGATLSLHRVPPPGETGAWHRIVLDEAFPAALDFVQDITRSEEGPIVVSRWSGSIHLVDDASGVVTSLKLPALAVDGLYYTATVRDDRLCATYCAGVTVVCRDLPED